MPALPAAVLRRRAALLATEGVRSTAEWLSIGPLSPLLVTAPRGDGHAVLVIPGWLATDTSTVVLRRYLRLLGYEVEGWRRGVNGGATAGSVTALRAQVRRMAQNSGGPVSVVG